MSVNNKKTERAELHRTYYEMTSDLHDNKSCWILRQRVLGMLLCRYISEGPSKYLELSAMNACSEGDFRGFFEDLDIDNKLGESNAEISACLKQSEFFRDGLISSEGVKI